MPVTHIFLVLFFVLFSGFSFLNPHGLDYELFTWPPKTYIVELPPSKTNKPKKAALKRGT